MSSNQGGGGKGGGSGKKPQGRGVSKRGGSAEEKSKQVRSAVGRTAGFTASAFSTSVEALSPFQPFLKYIRALGGLLLIAIIGNAFAFYEGSLLVATLILLIEPMFVMSLLSIMTRAFITPFANAVRGGVVKIRGGRFFIARRPTNMILRPVYDYTALLTVGLPYALAWFWEGKIIGIGMLMLSYINTQYLGYAIGYYVVAFSIASAILTIISRFGTRTPLKSLAVLMSSFSYILAIYTGGLMATLVFYIVFGKKIFPTIGAIGAFLLSFITIREMNRLSPSSGRFPATWSIIALIIGASALMGFYGIFIASMVAVTIYLVMLYLISGDAEWLWYTIIAVPSAPVVAYYLGYVTKLLLDNGGLFVGSVIANGMVSALFILYIIAIIAIIALFLVLATPELITAVFVDAFLVFVVIIFFIILIILFFMLASAIITMIMVNKMINTAYNYLVYPA
jgi:hypothetical protein